MGCCSSCFGSEESERQNVLTPDIEQRRRIQQEAAERRIQESTNRGIKNPASVARQQAKAEQMQRREEELARQGGGGATLRWQTG